MEIKELSNRIKEDNKYYIIAENYIKFFEFLKEVEKRIRNELFFKYTFEILLKFNREDEENSNASRIYNITCIYKLINPIDSKLFKDENILIYKTYSGNKGF